MARDGNQIPFCEATITVASTAIVSTLTILFTVTCMPRRRPSCPISNQTTASIEMIWYKYHIFYFIFSERVSSIRDRLVFPSAGAARTLGSCADDAVSFLRENGHTHRVMMSGFFRVIYKILEFCRRVSLFWDCLFCLCTVRVAFWVNFGTYYGCRRMSLDHSILGWVSFPKKCRC